MATQKLTGKNTMVYTFNINNPINGDDTTALETGIYLTNAIAAVSGLPVGAQVGKTFKVGDGAEIVLATGDKVYKLSEFDKSDMNKRCDISSLSAEFTFSEIDSTTKCDEVMTYEKGLAEATISVEGIITAGLSTDLISQFLPVASQSVDYKTIDNTDVLDDPFYFYTELTNGVTKAGVPEMALVFPGKFYSLTLGGAVDEMQTFSSDVRISSDDYLLPHIYELKRA
jgi:hypothetical protein